MAGFSDYAAIKTAHTLGQAKIVPFYYNTVTLAGAAGSWAPIPIQANLQAAPTVSFPPSFTLSGGIGVATALTSSNAGALPLVEGNVSPAKRYLSKLNIHASAGVPCIIILCDFLLYYQDLNTSTPTTLDNTVTLPRYTDGVGVKLMGPLGAASLVATVTGTDNSSYGSIDISAGGGYLYTAIVAGNIVGPDPFMFIPTNGVKNVVSYTIPSPIAGTADLFLVTPLATVQAHSASFPVEKDFIANGEYIQIQDGACLGFIVMGGSNSATANFMGSIEYVWG